MRSALEKWRQSTPQEVTGTWIKQIWIVVWLFQMQLFSWYSETLVFFNVLLSCTVLSQGIRKDVGFSINLSKGKGMVSIWTLSDSLLHFLVLFLTLILVHYATVFLNNKNQDTLNENQLSLFHLITSSRWAGSSSVSFTSVSLCCLVYTTDPDKCMKRFT